jgi:hypothetical protein
MGYMVFTRQGRFGPRRGLEGPFEFLNGQVLYYDPKAGQYWDPTTDFYVPNEDVALLQQDLMNMMRLSG